MCHVTCGRWAQHPWIKPPFLFLQTKHRPLVHTLCRDLLPPTCMLIYCSYCSRREKQAFSFFTKMDQVISNSQKLSNDHFSVSYPPKLQIKWQRNLVLIKMSLHRSPIIPSVKVASSACILILCCIMCGSESMLLWLVAITYSWRDTILLSMLWACYRKGSTHNMGIISKSSECFFDCLCRTYLLTSKRNTFFMKRKLNYNLFSLIYF